MEKTNVNISRKLVKTVSVAAIAVSMFVGATHVWASGTHSKAHAAKAVIGEAGNTKDVSRVIEIDMIDSAYAPMSIKVREGETVRFIVKNSGELMHEFAIGTTAMHAGHQKEMMAMMERGVLEADRINREKMKMGNGKTMEHKDPNSVLLEPGKSGEVIWKFAKAVDIEFACNVPGHYESGMRGSFGFEGKAAPKS